MNSFYQLQSKFNFVLTMLCLFCVFQADAQLGIAKEAQTSGRNITFNFYLENFDDTHDAESISFDDDLDAVFGAGNYSLINSVSQLSGPPLVINPGFNGSGNIEVVSNGTLPPGSVAVVTFTVEINVLSDVGSGLGVYFNQVTANATINLNPVSDLSHAGTDPDGNNNANPSDDSDVTLIDLLANPEVGLAKAVQINGTEITLLFNLENLGNRQASYVSVTDDLDAAFGAANYSIISAPILTDNPGTLTLNAGFNGSVDKELIASGYLGVGETAGFELTVDVTTVSDQGLGFGVYVNQAKAVIFEPSGQMAEDWSDEGLVVDENNNGLANQVGENDPTDIVIGDEAVIGIAKEVMVNGNTLEFHIYLENLGNVPLSSFELSDDLNLVLGAGNYDVSATPSWVVNPGTMQLNNSFDGNFDISLIDSGSLGVGESAQFSFVVDVIAISDQGFGLGNYENQIFVSASSASSVLTQDWSDDGTDPDTNGDGQANQLGENDATVFNVAPSDLLGVAKRSVIVTSGATPWVELFFTVTNYGNQRITDITISDDLNAVYGAGNYIHTLDPQLVAGANGFNFNTAYNGNNNTALLNAGSFLDPGESVTFKIGHMIMTKTDQGFGLGIYQNQVTAEGLSPTAANVSDLSHEGSDPDPNEDGIPDENDVTVIDANLIGSIGVATDAHVTGNAVTIDVYLENLGNVDVNNLDLFQSLDVVLGAGNYVINEPPFWIIDPGTITINPAYDGSTERYLIDPTVSSLLVGETAHLQFELLVNQVVDMGLGLGNFSMQSQFNGLAVSGELVSDVSDFGTDPDPNGNANADEAGENDFTTFSILTGSLVGVALDATVVNNQVTFDMYLENLGAENIVNLSLLSLLDDAFGIGNYSLISSPTLIDDPGTLILNGAYDGSLDADILSAGSSLNSGAVAQIRMVLTVDLETDQGNGFGNYFHQVVVNGQDTNGILVTDLSTDGINADPNGNNNPSDAGEDDPTDIIIAVNPSIGIAKKAYVSNTVVTFDFTIENLGDSTIDNIILIDDLNPVFGSGNYSILTQPTLISGPATLQLSPQYFGFNIFNRIVQGGYIQPNETIVIRTQVNLNTVTDVGNGLGVYFNSGTITGNDPTGIQVTDVSDNGIFPDTDGDGLANGAGEDDTTPIFIGDEAILGAALDVNVLGNQVTFDMYLKNYGGSELSNINVPFDLDVVFGVGNYTINSAAGFVDDPGTLILNPTFDGHSDINVFDAGSILSTNDTAQIKLVVDVNNVVDTGLGIGHYATQLLATGAAPQGSLAIDKSDDGSNPDSDGDGLPNGINESDVSLFEIGFYGIGLAKSVALDMTDPTFKTLDFTFYVENVGFNDLSDIQVIDDLDTVFGAGNYSVVLPPQILGNPRGFLVNPSFDGSSDINLLDTSSGEILPGSVVLTLTFKVQVNNVLDQGLGIGNFSNQAEVISTDGVATQYTDLSDSGSVADQNGDGSASGVGEDDPTLFSLLPVIPSFNKTFVPSLIVLNGVSNLVFEVDNSNSLFAATALEFTDNLPAGMVIATPANSSNSCGGVLTAIAGTGVIGLTGGTVGFGDTCQVSVDVTASVSGLLVNISGELTSNAGNSGTATDTLDVDAPPVITPPGNITAEANALLTNVNLGNATVTDDRDVGLVAVADNLGPYPVGVTVVNWSVTDSGGNTVSVQQSVTITDTTLPVITLLGNNPLNVNLGSSFIEPGFVANDLVDGDISNLVVVSGVVNTNVLGMYQLNYDVVDNAGNSALTVTRTINVVQLPTFTVGGNLAGLAIGESIVLQNNGTDSLTLSSNGTYTFATPVIDNEPYNVTVLNQPNGQNCLVNNGSGVMNGADVTDVEINCASNEVIAVDVNNLWILLCLALLMICFAFIKQGRAW